MHLVAGDRSKIVILLMYCLPCCLTVFLSELVGSPTVWWHCKTPASIAEHLQCGADDDFITSLPAIGLSWTMSNLHNIQLYPTLTLVWLSGKFLQNWKGLQMHKQLPSQRSCVVLSWLKIYLYNVPPTKKSMLTVLFENRFSGILQSGWHYFCKQNLVGRLFCGFQLGSIQEYEH